MSATAPASATTIAAASLALARTQPARARRKATEALGCARADGDQAAMSMAERALGVAAREQHELEAAVVHLRRAVRIAEASGLLTDAARARVDLSAALALRGSSALAFREADRAAAVLRGRDLALLQAQRAFLLLVMGRLADALQAYRQALPALRRHGDRFQEATALHNRGLIHIHLGELPTAEADLTKAEQLYSLLGRDRDAADARLNLGCVPPAGVISRPLWPGSIGLTTTSEPRASSTPWDCVTAAKRSSRPGSSPRPARRPSRRSPSSAARGGRPSSPRPG